jgi:asparagine N-glycosylation enzyme membrane subunit Stt3
VAFLAWSGIAFSELLAAWLPGFLFPEVAGLVLLLAALLARKTNRARDRVPAPGSEA